MMAEMKKCSIIIINYNTGKLLATVVQAASQDASVKEIIIVDNCSQDDSMDSVAENTRIKKFFRHKNYGFASSCNFARTKTSSEFLLFLNPDCLLAEDSLSNSLKIFSRDKAVAIIGCLVNNPDGSEQRASRRRLPTFMRAFKTYSGLEKFARFCPCFAGVNLNHQTMPETWQTVEAISGAFILMRSTVFDEIKGFDEAFPMHFEDLDLFKRTLAKGHKIAFNPKVSVIHHQGTSSQSNPKVAEMKKQGLQRYFYKHCSKLSFFLVKLLR